MSFQTNNTAETPIPDLKTLNLISLGYLTKFPSLSNEFHSTNKKHKSKGAQYLDY